MTYTTITRCVRDEEFQDRVVAGAMKEATAGAAEFSESSFGQQLRALPQAALNTFMWPLAIDNEAAYEYAVNSDNEHPGSDPGVISDGAIQAGIQAHWPSDALPTPVVPDQTITPS